MGDKMNKTIFITSVLFVIIASCQTIAQNNDIDFEVMFEDLVNNYNLPTEGYYYEYQFESYRDYIANVEDVLREYILSGIDLLDAWYKQGSSNCAPPNSQYGMPVTVPPNFVLRTKKLNNFLLNRNFIQVEEPPHFRCGYYVRHFIPKNN